MYKRYKVEIELITPILGTQATDPKARQFLEQREVEQREDEEVPESEAPSKQTFYIHDGADKDFANVVFPANFLPAAPCLLDYEIKGFFKQSAITLPEHLGVPGKKRDYPSNQTIKGYIDRWLFISPRHIPFLDSKGERKMQVEGNIIHPIRAMTRQGERITLIDSDLMNEGTRIKFGIALLQNCPIKGEGLSAWLEYGEEGIGLLGWRTGGWGRFKVVSFSWIEQAD